MRIIFASTLGAAALVLAACGGGASSEPESASGRMQADGVGRGNPATAAKAVPDTEARPSYSSREGAAAPASASRARAAERNIYIVQMVQDPVVAYRGNVAGYARTKPATGQKVDPNSPAVVRYAAFLESRHDA